MAIKSIKVLLTYLILLIFSIEGFCIDKSFTLENSWKKSYLIFTGKALCKTKVINLQDVFKRQYFIFTFVVKEMYKGEGLINNDSISILVDNLTYNDYEFLVDSTYLMYVNLRGDCSFFQVNRNSRTDFLSKRKDDLLYLKTKIDTFNTYVDYIKSTDTIESNENKQKYNTVSKMFIIIAAIIVSCLLICVICRRKIY